MTRAPGHLWSQLLDIPKESLDQFTLFSGHFYRPLHRYLGVDLDVLIFLRNPVDRSISHFEHVRRNSDHYFYSRVQKHNSFLEFVCDPVTRPLVENFQVRCIATQFDPNAFADLRPAAPDHPFALERSIETFGTQSTDETVLNIAKDYLMRAKAVGITESMERSFYAIASAFGWPKPAVVGRLNAAPNNSITGLRLSDRELEAVMEATRLDWALYEFGLSLFYRQS